MLQLAAAVVLLLATAVLAGASLRLPAFAGFALAVYVFAAAEIVLLTQILSLFHWVGALGYVVGEGVLFAVALVFWNRLRRPIPALLRVPLRSLRFHPALALLTLAVGISLCYQAFLVFGTPPYDWDSMMYHLARPAEWYQRGAVEYYPAHAAYLNWTQPNAEILTLYGFALAGRDMLAAVPQFLAELACIVTVYGMATRLGFSRPSSAFAALLTGTLTQVALQSVTTQNDLLAASFLAPAFYFVMGRETRQLAVAGLAIGLALGTKVTTAVGLPLLILLAALVLSRRSLSRGLGFAFIGFALVGAYGYVLNLVHTGGILGDPAEIAHVRPHRSPTTTVSIAARMTYDFVDLSGYPIPESVTEPIERAAERAFDVAEIEVDAAGSNFDGLPEFEFGINRSANEGTSYFGPLGVLVVLPLSVGFLVAVAVRRAPPASASLAAAIPLFVVGVAIGARYSIYNGRYFIPAVVLTMPLAASLYRKSELAAVVAALGTATLLFGHVQSAGKPVGIGEESPVWTLERAEAQTVMRREMKEVIERVEQDVRTDGRLGYFQRPGEWIYPFYGTGLERRLVLLPQRGLVATAEQEGVDAVLVDERLRKPVGWRVVLFKEIDWTLLLREEPLERGDSLDTGD